MTNLGLKDINSLEMKEWKKMYRAKSSNKKVGVDIVISDKKDSKRKKNLTRVKKVGHFIMKIGSMY